jgi:hypothetical protein
MIVVIKLISDSTFQMFIMPSDEPVIKRSLEKNFKQLMLLG